MSDRLPILGHTDPAQVFAWRAGKPVRAAHFVADVIALAERLPKARYLMNGCTDRYRFAVAMAAAMLRGQICVLPHNHVGSTLSHLQSQFAGLYCMTDHDDPLPDLVRIQYPDDLSTDESRAFRAGVFAPPGIAADQPAACLFTSGSTGSPVAHQRTWGEIVQSSLAEAASMRTALAKDVQGTVNGLAIVGTVPPQHSYGFESTVYLPVMAGWALVAERPFFPADVMAALEALPRPRMLVTTPVHLRALLSADRNDVPVDLALSATAPLPDDLAGEIEQKLGGPVYEIYGSTETGQVASRRTLAGDEWTPLNGVTIGLTGEQAWAEGGHVTGRMPLADRIALRGEGRFVLLGRTQDLVNIGGKRSSISFLDRQLLEIDGVRDGAFLFMDDDPVASRLTAFVVAPGVSPEQILSALRLRIEAVFLPRPLVPVDSLPRDGNGKLPRQRLLAMAEAVRQQRSGR